ncbi:MAG: hypothetical protein A2Z38_00360 [Planctomycetes bacterium RBG_19FT_COMBO_48_8]|nr:MAG: hypothetical protein A2Z38_00360 [Planctomycetes bacterium RBG_19FT_COMBO_48_8]
MCRSSSGPTSYYMFLLITPDKIFLKLAIDNKNVEKWNSYYLDNTGTGRQSIIIYILRAGPYVSSHVPLMQTHL